MGQGQELEHLKSKYLGAELVEKLTSPTPEEWIWERPSRGGAKVEYIPGTYFIIKLNEVFGFLWNSEVVSEKQEGDQIVVKEKLSIRVPSYEEIEEFPDGRRLIRKREGFEISKTQFGSSEIKRYSKDVTQKGNITHRKGDIIDLGDDYKGAATDAMKKCATQFGVGLDVYGKQREEVETRGPSSAQLEALYMRGKDLGMSEEQVDEFSKEQEGKPPQELEQIAILGLIQQLIKKAGTQGETGKV